MDSLPFSVEGAQHLFTNWFLFVTSNALVFAVLGFAVYIAYIVYGLRGDPREKDEFQLVVGFNDITSWSRTRQDTHFDIHVKSERKGFKSTKTITIRTSLSRPLRFRGVITNRKTHTALLPNKPTIVFIEHEQGGRLRQLRDSGDVIFDPSDESGISYFSVVNADNTTQEVKVLIKNKEKPYRRIQNGR